MQHIEHSIAHLAVILTCILMVYCHIMMGTMIFEEAVVLVSIRRKSKAADWEPPHFNAAPPHNSFFIIIINQHSVQQKIRN
jgi:hypothetical protein